MNFGFEMTSAFRGIFPSALILILTFFRTLLKSKTFCLQLKLHDDDLHYTDTPSNQPTLKVTGEWRKSGKWHKFTCLLNWLIHVFFCSHMFAMYVSGKNVEETPIVIADSGDHMSMLEMCQKTRVVLNCVGPVSGLGGSFVSWFIYRTSATVCMETC